MFIGAMDPKECILAQGVTHCHRRHVARRESDHVRRISDCLSYRGRGNFVNQILQYFIRR
jgi:hypothetical protein